MPFPIRPANASQVAPTGNPKLRQLRTSSADSYIGPSYGERSGNTDVRAVQGGPRRVNRYGVATGQRGEWKR